MERIKISFLLYIIFLIYLSGTLSILINSLRQRATNKETEKYFLSYLNSLSPIELTLSNSKFKTSKRIVSESLSFTLEISKESWEYLNNLDKITQKKLKVKIPN